MQMDAPLFFTNSGKYTVAMPHSHRPSCTPCAKKATANRLESEKISNFVLDNIQLCRLNKSYLCLPSE